MQIESSRGVRGYYCLFTCLMLVVLVDQGMVSRSHKYLS